jgi:hypothetical protein
MYYVRSCSFCSKVFYTYNNNREEAAKALYNGIKKHLIEYNEDDREYEFDEYPEKEEDQMYYEMQEAEEPPVAGYELE